jgi:hypothetical protein
VVPETLKELIEQTVTLVGRMREVVLAVDKEDDLNDDRKTGPWLKTKDGMRCQEEVLRVVKEDYATFPEDNYDCESILDKFFGWQEKNDERVVLPPQNVADDEYQVMEQYDDIRVCTRGQVRLGLKIFSLSR